MIESEIYGFDTTAYGPERRPYMHFGEALAEDIAQVIQHATNAASALHAATCMQGADNAGGAGGCHAFYCWWRWARFLSGKPTRKDSRASPPALPPHGICRLPPMATEKRSRAAGGQFDLLLLHNPTRPLHDDAVGMGWRTREANSRSVWHRARAANGSRSTLFSL